VLTVVELLKRLISESKGALAIYGLVGILI